MFFRGWIGDLCNGYFDGYFVLQGVVRVRVVDPTIVFVWTTTLDHSLPIPNPWRGKIQQTVIFTGTLETLVNQSLPTGSISPRVFYICCTEGG